MTEPTTFDAQFERIYGELALVNTKLDNEAQWRTVELKGVRNALDDLKTLFHGLRQEANAIASAVRVDLERQVGEVKVDLRDHEDSAHPHPEWEKALQKRYDVHEVALQQVSKRTSEQDGALIILRWVAGVLSVATAGVIVYAVTSLLSAH